MIVVDVLVELREHFGHRISLFSGIDFNVDTENDLTGVCDFLVSLSPNQYYLESPVIILVEAKKDDLITGLGQCAYGDDRCLPNALMPKKGTIFQSVFMVPLQQVRIGSSSNWKGNDSTLTWKLICLSDATKFSVSSQAWCHKKCDIPKFPQIVDTNYSGKIKL